MNKTIFTTTALLCSILMLTLSTSCNSDSGEKWLNSIFQCENGTDYCLPNDRDVFTERYYEFYLESLEIFEYPNFDTKEEEVAAKESYRKRWTGIYPLDHYIWSPFGRGNGMDAAERLENVTITRISNLEYNVLVEYLDGNVFSNDLLLVSSGDTFLIDYIATELREGTSMQVEYSDLGIDNLLPIFMVNEANTVLYDEASNESKIIFIVEEESNHSLISLTAVKDAVGNVWYRCYYPKQQLEGWTCQISHWSLDEDEKHLAFLQNLTLANLQLGANPQDAERVLGKPLSEHNERGPMEVSGYIDEDYIVTTTTMEYESILLIYKMIT